MTACKDLTLLKALKTAIRLSLRRVTIEQDTHVFVHSLQKDGQLQEYMDAMSYIYRKHQLVYKMLISFLLLCINVRTYIKDKFNLVKYK